MCKNNRYIIFTVSIVLLLSIGYILFNRFYEAESTLPYIGHFYGGWMMPFGMIGMSSLWICILYFMFRVNHKANDDHEDSVQILKKRLSKGEISIDEYEALKEKLKE